MDKELLQHNMDHMGKYDKIELLAFLVQSNEKAAKHLVSCIEKENGDFKPHPGETTGDIDTLEYYAKRGAVLKEILQAVENIASCEDFVGMASMKELEAKYLDSTKSEDLGDKRKEFCAARAKLVGSVADLVELRNWKFQDDLQYAKIKALIDLL